MTLMAEIEGIPYTDAISISVNRSIRNMVNEFSIETSANAMENLPVRTGNTVVIYADGNIIFNGFVDRISMNNSRDSHSLSVQGRERTQDLLDSTVTGATTFSGGLAFTDIARRVLDAGNMQDIEVINETGVSPTFLGTDIVSADIGDGAFDFLEKLARKLQFVLTTNEDGNLLMLRASQSRLPMRLINERGGQNNNVLSSSMTKDLATRYNQYNVVSQLNPVTSSEPAASIVSQLGSGIDSEIRQSRILTINSEEELDNSRVRSRAAFEANIRRAASLEYYAVIQGNSIHGDAIKLNRLVFVKDDLAGIASDMLLHTVRYSFSASGSATSLGFSFPDAFTLEVEQNARDIARSETAGVF